MDFSMSPHYELTDVLDAPETNPIPPIRSQRARTVAEWFGVTEEIRRARRRRPHNSRAKVLALRSMIPRSSQVTFLSGPSGAGKSSILRVLRALSLRARWIDLDAIELPSKPLVDCFGGAQLDHTLALLGQVGLGEAWTYLRTPQELSEGQKWRLKLALAVFALKNQGESASFEVCPAEAAADADRRVILVADEFAALLDRVSAAIVARCLRRVVDSTAKLSAIVATSHQDLLRALSPDILIQCDFRQVEVYRRVRSARLRPSQPRRPRRSRAIVPRVAAARRRT